MSKTNSCYNSLLFPKHKHLEACGINMSCNFPSFFLISLLTKTAEKPRISDMQSGSVLVPVTQPNFTSTNGEASGKSEIGVVKSYDQRRSLAMFIEYQEIYRTVGFPIIMIMCMTKHASYQSRCRILRHGINLRSKRRTFPWILDGCHSITNLGWSQTKLLHTWSRKTYQQFISK